MPEHGSEPHSSPGSSNGAVEIIVRISHEQTVQFTWPKSVPLTARQVKQQIRRLQPSIAQRRLKIIHAGRVISNDSFLPLTGIATNGGTLNVLCALGDELGDGEQDEGPEIQQQQRTAPLGLERFYGAGLSTDEIMLVRNQFQNTYGTMDTMNQLRAEDDWIDNNESNRPLVDGTGVLTVVIGAALGISAPLFLAFGMFRRDQFKHVLLGALLGLSMQLMFHLL